MRGALEVVRERVLAPALREIGRPALDQIAGPLVERPEIDAVVAVDVGDVVEERRLIAKQYSADAIDMETEVIARSCNARGIPMASMRVISDSLTARFPAPPDVLFDLDRQKTKFSRLVPYVLTHPFALGRLIAFAGQINHSRSRLTAEIINAVATLHK